MKETILSFLQGIRDFSEGVILYEQYGNNNVLKFRLRTWGQTEQSYAILIEELRKIADISVEELERLPRKAYSAVRKKTENNNLPSDMKEDLEDLKETIDSKEVEIEDLEDELQEKESRIAELEDELQEKEDSIAELEEKLRERKKRDVPEEITNAIRFRDKYPFLREATCPDELKILVSDMFTAHDKYREAHHKLADTPADVFNEETFELARTAVENYVDNREMWAELDHYSNTGQVLGTSRFMKGYKERKEVEDMDNLQLTKQLMNARSNLSKARKKNTPQLIERWESRIKLLTIEYNKRGL